jgi:(p)ppGpp synthase/HD superfamily hydrolase
MNQMPANDSELRQIAVLHDLVEDTAWTLEDLRKHLFSARVINGVGCLTKREFEKYDDYIKRIGTNYDAIRVKLADLEHNSCITRLKGVTPKDIARIEKYHNAYLYLKGFL